MMKISKLKRRKIMKMLNIKNMLVAGATIALMSGCGQMGPEAKKGALVGGAGAAGVTALVGGSTRSVATAAAVGAVLGGVYGDTKDKENQ
jgi:hypothetical protein